MFQSEEEEVKLKVKGGNLDFGGGGWGFCLINRDLSSYDLEFEDCILSLLNISI